MGSYTTGTKLWKPAPSDGALNGQNWAALVNQNFDRLSEYEINAKSFLKGDGTTESSIALADFAAAAVGKPTYWPPSEYALPTGYTLSQASFGKIRGAGSNTVITGENAYLITAATYADGGGWIRDVYLRLRTGSTSGGCIDHRTVGVANYKAGVVWHNVTCEGKVTSLEPCVRIGSWISSFVDHLRIDQQGGTGLYIDPDWSFNGNSFRNIYVHNSGTASGTAGLHIEGGQGTHFKSGVIEGCGGDGSDGAVFIENTAATTIEGMHFEGNESHNIKLAGTSATSLVRNLLLFTNQTGGPGTEYRHIFMDDGANNVNTIIDGGQMQNAPSASSWWVKVGSGNTSTAFRNVSGLDTQGGGARIDNAGIATTLIGGDGQGYQALNLANTWIDPSGRIMMKELADPDAPPANMGSLYVKDNGSGKSQLVIRFPSGAVQVIATEP
jgi:hypothetical protein